MDLSIVQYEERSDRLVHVILDRPPANALSEELMDEISEVTSRLERSQAQVVVLRSAQKMFMAGADLKMVNQGWDVLRATIQKAQAMMNRWEQLPMMTVAVINGHAAGAGCELTLASDFRLMARGKPMIGLPEVLRGLLPGAGGTQRMSRLIGRGAALDLCLRGRLIGADEAARVGLITEAVDAEELDAPRGSAHHRAPRAPPVGHAGDQAVHRRRTRRPPRRRTAHRGERDDRPGCQRGHSGRRARLRREARADLYRQLTCTDRRRSGSFPSRTGYGVAGGGPGDERICANCVWI